jgi:flagella basal body P-ring formation protein FlgA
MGRCERIVGSPCANISANNGGFTGQFAATAGAALAYSAAMDTRPAPTLAARSLRAWRRGVAVLAAVLAAPLALAQATPPGTAGSGLDSGLEQQVRQLAFDGSHAGTPGTPGAPRVEVEVGQLDPRLRLAPCAQVQPYIPDGVRLWGKSRIGLRCQQGAVRWNVYLPITVKVFGTALVATGALSSGSVLTAADLTPAEVDLAEDNSAPVANPELAVGRTLARALKPGQSLRQSSLRARQWFSAGETVTVLAQGDGFSVAGEAQALNPGIEGQPVRVRTESGRVLTGQPVGERRVELGL